MLKMNAGMSKTSKKHLTRNRSDGSQPIYLKVQYSDGSKAYQTLDAVRLHDPLVVAKYGMSKGFVGKPGWEWIPYYIQQNPA